MTSTGRGIVREYVERELPENLRPQQHEIREFVDTLVPDILEQLLEQFQVSTESDTTQSQGTEQPQAPSDTTNSTSDSSMGAAIERSDSAPGNTISSYNNHQLPIFDLHTVDPDSFGPTEFPWDRFNCSNLEWEHFLNAAYTTLTE
jgi:hypothetical protein